MTRTLTLHIGLHKTGTTAIQRFMHENRKRLARQGVLWPVTGVPGTGPSWGHHGLAEALLKGDGSGDWPALAAESATWRDVVVSSETLSLVPVPGPLGAVKAAFPPPDWTIRVLCYLRPQGDYLASLYNHHVKALGEAGPIAEFGARVDFRLRYLRILSVMEAAFGEEAIAVRGYGSDCFRSDLFDDFLDACRVAREARRWWRPPATVNPSLDAKGVDRMRRANAELAGDQRALENARREIVARHRAPAFKGPELLTGEERAALAAAHAADNRALVARFAPHLEGFLA